MVIILFPKKLKQPISPIEPTILPINLAPCASAASSITWSLCLTATSVIVFNCAGCPYKCTGIIALVLTVIANSSFCGSIFHVSSSESIKTGLAPVYATAFAVAINVNDGIRTSSPVPIPNATKAKCNATVPFETASAYLHPQYSENCFSNISINLPLDEIQFSVMHSVKYFNSLPSSDGRATGISVRAIK